MRFIVDAQLPPALARKLTEAGHDAEHLLDVGLLEAADGIVWDYALEHEAIILTKDEDFAIRASVRQDSPSIVWIRIGNCSNGRLLTWLDNNLDVIVEALESGNRLIEVAA